MSGLLKRPKILAILVVLGVLSIAGLAGGALGNEFGGGFLGAPIAHLQLPAENLTSEPHFLDFTVTNTMLATWITIVILAVLAFFATRRITDVPRGLQNLFEAIIEYFLNLAETVAGRDQARKFFPLVMTIFLFIVTANWLGVLPGFGTIGRIETAEEVIHHAEENEEHPDLADIRLQVFDGDGAIGLLLPGSIDDEVTAEDLEHGPVEPGKRAGRLAPFLRSANTDVNTTLAITLVAMFLIHWWAFRKLGVFAHMSKFVRLRNGPIWALVGILEAISELARIISFTFRLFGNIFAGEVLLVAMAFLIPLIGILPFIGLELFVGLIQAFIFAMLALVFAATASASHGTDEH